MRITIRALSADLFPALQDVFNDSPVCSRCWCMYWRLGNGYRKRSASENMAHFKQLVLQDMQLGLLAFDGELAVGWCQLTPRKALQAFDRMWRLRPVDDLPVWSISCLYVRKSHRRNGVTSLLIRAAIASAKKAKAAALEAYPFDAEQSRSSTGTGYASTYARLGFKTVARRVPARPIMRHDLKVGS